MGQLKTPPEPSRNTILYNGINGCDFSNGLSISRHRSPDMLNMISDNGGDPKKRKGWEIVNADKIAHIDNIWSFVLGGTRRCLVASGTEVQELDLTEKEYVGVATATTAGKKAGFLVQSPVVNGFFILNKTNYLQAYMNGETFTVGTVTPHVPTTVISRDPNGGGVSYEAVNLLTRERTDSFLNNSDNASAKKFVLTSTLDTNKAWKAEYLNASSVWTQDSSATVTGATVTLSVNAQPIVSGEDNVKVTYFATGEDKSGRVMNCTEYAYYNQTTVDQIFISGNPDYPQYVWYSGQGDPTYFPDINYLFVGGSGTKVMGFLNIGEYLGVVKEHSGQEPTVFLLTPKEIQDQTVALTEGTTQITTHRTRTEYAVRQSTAGIGATSSGCFKVLNDEPLFLSRTGVCGIISTNTTSEKITRNRSTFVNKRLTEEPNLENAVAEVYDNYYILAVNDHCYVLDGRQTSGSGQNYAYETYYWDNIPAKCFMSYDEELYFGTADGKVCRFKFTDDSMGVYSDNGEAIVARYSTIIDDDGKPQYLKTMTKRGSLVTLTPFLKSSVDVYCSLDANPRVYIGSSRIDIFGFENIDFERFTFNSNKGARDKFFNKKIKNYKRLQLIFENVEVNEGFGVHEVIKTIEYTKYAKV